MANDLDFLRECSGVVGWGGLAEGLLIAISYLVIWRLERNLKLLSTW